MTNEMTETQRRFVIETQGESLRKRFDLDEILDVNDFEVPDQRMSAETYFSRRIYGIKEDKLFRVRGVGGDIFAKEEIKIHPYKRLGLDIGIYSLASTVITALVYGASYAASHMEKLPEGGVCWSDRPLVNLPVHYLILGVVAIGALKFFPSFIRDSIYESKLWNKFKNLKVKGGNEK